MHPNHKKINLAIITGLIVLIVGLMWQQPILAINQFQSSPVPELPAHISDAAAYIIKEVNYEQELSATEREATLKREMMRAQMITYGVAMMYAAIMAVTGLAGLLQMGVWVLIHDLLLTQIT